MFQRNKCLQCGPKTIAGVRLSQERSQLQTNWLGLNRTLLSGDFNWTLKYNCPHVRRSLLSPGPFLFLRTWWTLFQEWKSAFWSCCFVHVCLSTVNSIVSETLFSWATYCFSSPLFSGWHYLSLFHQFGSTHWSFSCCGSASPSSFKPNSELISSFNWLVNPVKFYATSLVFHEPGRNKHIQAWILCILWEYEASDEKANLCCCFCWDESW